jgi:hypothetical protein
VPYAPAVSIRSLQKPFPMGNGRELRTVASADFFPYAVNHVFYRLVREAQFLGDLFVQVPLDQVDEYRPLPSRQRDHAHSMEFILRPVNRPQGRL